VGDDPIYAGGGPLIGDGYAACDMAGFVDDCALGRKRRCEGLLLETGRWYDGISCGCHGRIEVYFIEVVPPVTTLPATFG
jgi:hypothetical protein